MYLSSSSDDNSVRVHNLMLKKDPCVATFTQHVSLPTQICSTSDSSLLISAGRDKVMTLLLFVILTTGILDNEYIWCDLVI